MATEAAAPDAAGGSDSLITSPSPDSNEAMEEIINISMDDHEHRISSLMSQLRLTVRNGQSKSMSWRRTQLLNLQTMMREGAPLLTRALWQDLNKSATESFMMEISMVNSEIQYHLDKFETWALPKKVSTNVTNYPATSYTYQEPLGTWMMDDG